MPDRTLVALPCELSPGMVSGERVFVVTLANGKSYSGIAPRFFCWTADGRLVGRDEPKKEVDGLIAARVVDDELEGNQIVVEVPDGVVIAVDQGLVKPRPTEIRPPIHQAARPTPGHPRPDRNTLSCWFIRAFPVVDDETVARGVSAARIHLDQSSRRE